LVLAAIHESLLSAAVTFSVLSPLPSYRPEGERYSPLFAALGGWRDVDETSEGEVDYPLAIELIYEGYLLHYRRSRVASPGGGDGSRLLAGDYLYARGLRVIATAGDVDAVRLLTRLMAVCSYLRSEQADFALDDDVWAFTVAAIAALRQGCPVSRPEATFAALGDAIVAGQLDRLPGLLREGAAALALRDARPLEAHLRGFRAAA
jgi:hypothetical protein